ncbi:hypothetical protein TEA_011960 [Camellia sinensis var. sinensis]|uniref:Uncharacterized protein n=1 Tax=Camellia sinensis var. sinensis TaxID=542762 RepID=A0A4S4D0W8_CAMSN|nr:hypothetical protein TEA_011960 [Camellia sinensis var. sinensis]
MKAYWELVEGPKSEIRKMDITEQLGGDGGGYRGWKTRLPELREGGDGSHSHHGKVQLVVLSGQVFKGKQGKDITVECRRSMKRKWRECDMFSAFLDVDAIHSKTVTASIMPCNLLRIMERIKRMQSVFNRERNKNKRSYESWRESGPGVYHQHFQREDWYWKTDTSYRDQRTNFRGTPRDRANYAYSHHYSVLGLDRLRTKPYTDDEIKVFATI